MNIEWQTRLLRYGLSWVMLCIATGFAYCMHLIFPLELAGAIAIVALGLACNEMVDNIFRDKGYKV